MSLKFDIFPLALKTFVAAFAFTITILIGFVSIINGLVIVFSAVSLVYHIVLLLKRRPKLVFDANGIKYITFPYPLTSYKFLAWSEVSTFEYQIDDFEGNSNYFLILERKNLKSQVKIRISDLEVEPDEIIKEFRYIARVNNVFEFLCKNL